MTQLPNIITLLRIAGSMGLLFCDVMGVAIWIIYGLCGISDIFHTNKTDAIVFGYRELTTHNPARRTFMLDLTWKFNEARSKYRGSGAGEKQKARM